jgi:integrase
LKSYSLQKKNGNWEMRWSHYTVVEGIRKRTQPSFIVASLRNYPKKADVKTLADAHFEKVKRSRTVRAGGSVGEFVKEVFVPHAEQNLKFGTKRLYRDGWRYLEPHIGGMRLRDVQTPHIQHALDAIHDERGEVVGHDTYKHIKVTASAIFTLAIRRGDHPGPNPEDFTTVKNYGHTNHRENGAYTLNEIKQLLQMWPTGDIAVAICINAFLALRKPEVEALLPSDYDASTGRVHIHSMTKTGNSEWLPVVGPLRAVMESGWTKVNMRQAGYTIGQALKSTSLKWKGWYAFRRGLLTNLWTLKIPVETAALMLRNSPEICRKHYLRLDAQVSKQSAMDTLEKAYDAERLPDGARVQ